MKQNKFDGLMIILSFCFSLIGAAIVLYFMDISIDTISGTILWNGFFFSVPLLCSLIGITLSEFIHSKKYILREKGNRRISFVIAFVLSMAIGCGGQTLYMLDFEWDIKTVGIGEENKIPQPQDGMDISILFDASNSMNEKIDECKTAAMEFVQEFDENVNLQVIDFAAKVFFATDLLPMNDENKIEIQNTINAIDHAGKTDFDQPLQIAADTLLLSESKNKGIVVVTDGKCSEEISSKIQKEYIDNGIVVCHVNVDTLDKNKNNVFKDFVDKTNGKVIDFDNNKFNSKEILRVISSDGQGNSQSEENENIWDKGKLDIRFGQGLLPFGFEDLNILKLIIRFLMFSLYGILASYVMYYSLSMREIKTSLITGLVATAICSSIGGLWTIGMILATIIICLGYWTAFTIYQPTEWLEYDETLKEGL